MRHVLHKLRAFLAPHKDADGATAVEYAVMVALITAVIAGSVALIGRDLNQIFSSIAATVRP